MGNKKDKPSFLGVQSGVSSTADSIKIYTVAAGDTLAKIALRFYGNANLYMQIFNANTDQLSDPNNIKIGQVLKIPPRKS